MGQCFSTIVAFLLVDSSTNEKSLEQASFNQMKACQSPTKLIFREQKLVSRGNSNHNEASPCFRDVSGVLRGFYEQFVAESFRGHLEKLNVAEPSAVNSCRWLR